MQEKTWHIRPYETTTDMALAFTLWQASVGQLWPIDLQRFQQILAAPNAAHFVAHVEGQIVGLVATSHDKSWNKEVGYLQVLLVAPAWRGKGLGSALHEYALDHLRVRGVQSIRLGGHSPRFWCGVPENLPGALAFFQAHGWQFTETVYDLIQDLRQYSTPPAVEQRVREQGILFHTAREENIAEVLAFEEREFPNWLPHYEHLAYLGEYRDILVAEDQNGHVLGTLLMSTPASHTERTDVVWRILLGSDAGSMGAVGVAVAEQGRGIGIALVAHASDLLKARGVKNCYIDWVVLTDFYARLGYRKWRAFAMSEI